MALGLDLPDGMKMWISREGGKYFGVRWSADGMKYSQAKIYEDRHTAMRDMENNPPPLLGV